MAPFIRSRFDELAVGMHWPPDSEIAMLRAYFDESGEHDKGTGREIQTSLGGCLGSEESWEKFSEEWAAALPSGMDMFHMADFENLQDVCKDWDERRRNKLLDNLLDIMGRHVIQFFGFTNKFLQSGNHRKVGYREGVLEAIFNVIGCASALEEPKIKLVFAKEPQFGTDKIERALKKIDHIDTRLCWVTIADPRNVEPLQAADIVAYETMHFHKKLETSLLDAWPPLRQLVNIMFRLRLRGHCARLRAIRIFDLRFVATSNC
jgi:hypothetical protein